MIAATLPIVVQHMLIVVVNGLVVVAIAAIVLILVNRRFESLNQRLRKLEGRKK